MQAPATKDRSATGTANSAFYSACQCGTAGSRSGGGRPDMELRMARGSKQPPGEGRGGGWCMAAARKWGRQGSCDAHHSDSGLQHALCQRGSPRPYALHKPHSQSSGSLQAPIKTTCAWCRRRLTLAPASWPALHDKAATCSVGRVAVHPQPEVLCSATTLQDCARSSCAPLRLSAAGAARRMHSCTSAAFIPAPAVRKARALRLHSGSWND